MIQIIEIFLKKKNIYIYILHNLIMVVVLFCCCFQIKKLKTSSQKMTHKFIAELRIKLGYTHEINNGEQANGFTCCVTYTSTGKE